MPYGLFLDCLNGLVGLAPNKVSALVNDATETSHCMDSMLKILDDCSTVSFKILHLKICHVERCIRELVLGVNKYRVMSNKFAYSFSYYVTTE